MTLPFARTAKQGICWAFTTQLEGKPEILQVMLNSSMQKAGVQAGDIIREINGVKIENSQELMSYLKEHPLDGEKVSLGIERNGKVETIAAKPQMTKQIDSGFVYNIYREKTNFLGVLRYSVTEVRYWISTTVESLAMLIKGQFTVNDLSVPCGNY